MVGECFRGNDTIGCGHCESDICDEDEMMMIMTMIMTIIITMT